MVPMATEAQQAGRPPETVVEFGTEPGETRTGRPRWSASGLVTGAIADRRAVPLAALLGGLALFGSLISEWQITSVDMTAFGGDRAGNRPMPSGVADLGGWAGGYLAGLLVLAAAMVLVLFGPPAGRRYARLIGLSSAGVLLAALAAIAQSLKHTSRGIELVYTMALSPDQLQLSYGRGLFCAIGGVLAVTLALYLAGQHLESAEDSRVGATEPGAGRAVEAAAPDSDPGSSFWRRPRPAGTDEEPAAAQPIDLTVSSAPYTQLNQDHRDKPNST